MKYKVGDKVRVRRDLQTSRRYGSYVFSSGMDHYKGSVVTISKEHQNLYFYCIEEDEERGIWTDEMFEGLVEDELTAEEAIRLYGEICRGTVGGCIKCPVSSSNNGNNLNCTEFIKTHPGKAVEILKQYKKDHEKKPIETEFALYVQIIEVDTHILKHEEKVETDIRSMDVQKAEILKKYCSEHDGKYYAISERRCVVKEQS